MKIFLHLYFILNLTILNLAQINQVDCGTLKIEGTNDYSQKGGRYITSMGDLKVLVVFAKFKDDTNAHQFWPADSYPSELNNFIDSDMQMGSSHFMNLTNYYNQMSFGNFRVTGKTIGAETPYPVSHYIPENGIYPDRSLANKDILLSIDDSIDYREFDNWANIIKYNNVNEPDGTADMVIVIWRGFVFSENWSGEASLGGGSEFMVESNQIKIKMGYGGYGTDGSGVTVQYWGERTPERNFKVTIHEVAHWLIQSEHPYSNVNHTFWGMLTLGSEGICANTFERERVSWINPISIDGTILSAPMGDYITTPSSYKYHPENGYIGEMFYFENHQRLSIYDNVSSNPDDKGIFIVHISNGFYIGDCVRVLTSNGFWNWDSPGISDCWGNDMPAFRKISVNRNGFGNRDKIISIDSVSEFLYSIINEDDEAECNDWLHGLGFTNAFNVNTNDVFSKWSNPPAKTFDGQQTDFLMEVINQSGNIVTARFAIANSLGGKPSRPPLGLDPNFQNQSDILYLAWGADVWDGLQIEPDVNWSELQLKIGSDSWNTVYSGSNRFWSDGNVIYDPNRNESIYFRVRVRDSQNKWSMWSDAYESKKLLNNITEINPAFENPIQISEFCLSQNYPNPFNPSTSIRFEIPQRCYVQLKIYDLLGIEIAILVDEVRNEGFYTEIFDAENLPSGVYLYSINIQTTNGVNIFRESKKMMIVK